ncbi:MAG: hypothetical protein LQ352_004354 [Teloschistes flavicans]|nr:MAG: hypothetical protein LQ352_004354 [Teloschistes flavicans]
MFRWLNGPGAAFRDPLPGSTNYLNAYDPQGNLIRARGSRAPGRDPGRNGSENETKEQNENGLEPATGRIGFEQNIAGGRPIPKEQADDLIPFPMNRQFRSQPVLSEELRDEIYRRITKESKSVRRGKPLANPYARAVNSMLPKTPFDPSSRVPPQAHEPINDLPVHSATIRQLFHPVSESMHFNRESAAKAFDRNLLPADKRIPHPELIELARVASENRGRPDILNARRQELEQEEATLLNKRREQKARHEAATKKVDTPRWQFRFENIKVESAGRDGRGRGGVGARYGVPAQDRKKGQIKIPTKVE